MELLGGVQREIGWTDSGNVAEVTVADLHGYC